MNQETIKNFAIGAALIMGASIVLLAVESRGKMVESRFGIIGIALVILLLIVASVASAKIEKEEAKAPVLSTEQKNRGKSKKHE